MNARSVLLGALALVSITGCQRRRRGHEPDPSVRISVDIDPNGGSRSRGADEPTEIFWSTRANELLDGAHSTHPTRAVRCPANGTVGPSWGTDVYTADSTVCTAALHSGLVDLAQGGVVHIARAEAQSAYRGSVRNGVVSREFAVFPAAFRFVEGTRAGLTEAPIRVEGRESPSSIGPWERTMREQRGGDPSVAHEVQCPPNGTLRNVWGTDVYTDDSSVCSAAVHAGLLSLAQGGAVRVFVGAEQIAYAGSSRNGVSTMNYGRFAGSFAFDRGAFERVPRAPAGSTALAWNDTLASRRAERIARERVWCPPHGVAGSVWGTDVYTDDSSVCAAAVHAGMISLSDGGVFTVSNGPGRDRFIGTSRHGITSNEFARYEGSFRLTR